MNTFKLSISIAILAFFSNLAIAQEEIEKIKELWSKGEYSVVLSQLVDYRKKPYGKNAAIDYMIATSACRIPEKVAAGKKIFSLILKSYDLGAEERKIIEDEMDKCSSSSDRPIKLSFSAVRASGSVGVSGKRHAYYYNLINMEKTLWGENNRVPIGNSLVKIVKPIPYESIKSRVYLLSEKKNAYAFYKKKRR